MFSVADAPKTRLTDSDSLTAALRGLLGPGACVCSTDWQLAALDCVAPTHPHSRTLTSAYGSVGGVRQYIAEAHLGASNKKFARK
jgi:hypothetical protein